MNRRTLLAGIGGASIAGTAGCYGLAQMIGGDDNDKNSDGNQSNTTSDENASDSALSDEENAEGNGTSENATDEQQGESGEEGNTSDEEGSTRPDDPVDTISVMDHGLDVSASDDPDVDREVVCYGTFEAGEYDLQNVRIDAVALAENGDRIDHGWVPFAQVGAGESYDVDIPFYVNPDEINEYLIGATEATYAE